MYKQILVPLEEGKDSWPSLDHARELAAELGAALVLLRVITVLPAGHEFDRRLQIEVGSRGARVKAAAEAELGQLEQELIAQGVEASTAIVSSEESLSPESLQPMLKLTDVTLSLCRPRHVQPLVVGSLAM